MAVEVRVPALGESISEATIGRWLKNVGESVALDEPVAELETDKVSVELPAPSAGVLSAQHHPEGSAVRVGDSIGTIDPEGVGPKKAAPRKAAQEERAPAPSRPQARDARPLTPTERQRMREQGADARVVEGAEARERPSLLEEIVPMSPLRRRIAERLVQAQHTAAILTTFNEVDMSSILALRSRYQDDFMKRHDIKLGFMSFFVRACAASLRDFPGLNAEIRGSDIVYKKHYDFGIAVGSGRGLVVPVVRGVDQLGFADIEKKIACLAQRAKDNKLTLEELSGGTFTITNGGIYGSMMSTPLLNLPQTGILGMHKIMQRPVAVGDSIALRPMMYLALSYDHRVVDGREAVQFLVQVKERLEAPEKLLLDL